MGRGATPRKRGRGEAGKTFALGKSAKKSFKAYTDAPNRAKAQAAMSYRAGGFAGMEFKFFDTHFHTPVPCLSAAVETSMSGIGVDPVTNCLNSPVPGDTASSRNGRSIIAQNIEVQGIVSLPMYVPATTGAPVAARYVYVALILDTMTNGQPLDTGHVWVNPAGAAAAGRQDGSVVPLRNLAERTRFRVLAVKRVQLVPQVVATGGYVVFNAAHFRFYRKLGFEQNFLTDDTTATVASISNHSLHLCAVASSDDYNSSPLEPTYANLTYNARFRFTG